MNEKEMLAAVKKAANAPADGWGVTWNPLYNSGHCAELIVSKRVRIEWKEDQCWVSVPPHANGVREFFNERYSTPQQAMRIAVCRAVIGGAS